MSKIQKIGKDGERFSCTYLQQKGYKILAQNYRYKAKEIDIIASMDDSIVFVEVKTRTGFIHQSPEMAVDKRKQRFLCEAASYYMEKHSIDKEARFDIIALIKEQQSYKIKHIESAFMHGI